MANKLKAVDPIDQILDEKNTDNVVLYDDEHKPIEFEQVALIPLDNEKLYTIMIPITPMENVAEGEGVLFEVKEEERDLAVVNDESIIDKVLTIYEKLLKDGDNN